MKFDLIDFLMKTYMVVLPAVVGYIIWLLQEGKKTQRKQREENNRRHVEERIRQEANSKGTMLMLRYMLSRYHTEFMLQEFITSEQFRNFEEIFNSYRALGGNSVAVKWYEEIKSLEVRDDKPVGLTVYAKEYLNEREGED